MADNATRLKILASVEGIQGFDSLKRSLQGLAQEGQQSGRSLDRLYTATQQLAGAGKNSVNSLRMQVQALTQLRDAAEIGSRRYRILGQDIERVNQQLRQASAAQPAGGGAGAGLIGGLAARFAAPLAAGAGAAAAATAGLDAEAQQVRLKALTDQYGEYTQAQAAAATVAQTLRLSTAEAQKEFANLYGALRPAGVTVRELEDALIGFGAAARNSGATAQETAGAVLQLKQALASGRLQGEELRAIREQAPLVTQAIAKEMGISIGELKKAGEEGRITTEIMLKALSKLRETELGKLNQQFNTAQQAVADLGNAFKDTSAELFKLFGPSAILGLKSLTDAIRGVGNELKIIESTQAARSVSATGQALAKMDLPLQSISKLVSGTVTQIASLFANPVVVNALKIIGTAYEKETEGPRKLLAAGAPLTYKDDIGNVYDTATGRLLRNEKPALSREAIADAQAAADEGRRRSAAAAAAGKEQKVKLPEYIPKETLRNWLITKGFGRTTGDYTNRGHKTPNHMLNAMDMGILGGSDAEALRRTTEMERILRATGAFGTQLFGPESDSYGHGAGKGGSNIHLHIPTPGGMVRMTPGLASLMGIAGAGQEGKYELQQGLMEQVTKDQQKAQKLAEQRQKDQQEYGKKQQEEADQNQSIYNQLQARLQVSKALTEEEKIRAEYGVKINDLETQLTEEISNMTDPVQARIREELRRNEIYQTRIDMLQEIADLQAKQQSEQISAQWQDQQVTLAATLNDYYSQQSEKLQEQNQYAESLAQTIGQGMSQAFNLAIQGAENLGESLRQLGATVLRDIAQQLIQIAVIAPVVNAIGNIGRPSPFAPISPGINALPGGDFSSFFPVQGVGSFAAGLPTVGFTGAGLPGTGFANGGIMTPQGPVPLRTYARGGIATAPQAAIFGEGSTPEAFIPLPDGRRVPVALKQYPGIPGASGGGGQFESTDQVVQRLVETARQESTARAAAVAAGSPDGTVRIKLETTRINSVDYVSVEQAEALAQAAATRSTARQQRALQASPGARRSLGI